MTADVLTWTMVVLSGPLGVDEPVRMAALDEAMVRLGDPVRLQNSAYLRAGAYARAGDLAGVDRSIAILETAANHGSAGFARQRSVVRSFRMLAVGDVEAAQRHADAARRQGERLNLFETPHVWQAQMFSIEYATGLKFRSSVSDGQHFSRPSLDEPFELMSRLAQGALAEGVAAFGVAAAQHFAGTPKDYLWTTAMSGWCGVAFMLRLMGVSDAPIESGAALLHAMLLPHKGRFIGTHLGLAQSLDSMLSIASFAGGRFDEAVAHARDSVALCERTGTTLNGSLAKAVLAVMLLARSTATEADRAEARAVLDDAQAWADAHGTQLGPPAMVARAMFKLNSPTDPAVLDGRLPYG